MYVLAGLAPPRMIVWCGSPVSLGLARAITFDSSLRERVEAFGPHSISESIWRSISASVDAAGGTVAGYCFRNHVMHNILMSVLRSVGASVGEGVWTRVFETVRNCGWDNVADSVSVWDDVRAAWGNGANVVLSNTVIEHVDAQHDVGLLGAYRYFSEVLGLKSQTEKLAGLWELAQSAGAALPHQNICWISERRRILQLDEDGFLHALAGPACAYPDGFAIYAIRGVRVPAYVVDRPHEITIAKIDDETNAESRRVMIDRYRLGEEISGAAAFTRDAGGERLDHDARFGTLWRRIVPDDEPIVILEVVNATPEKDGTRKHYWLRVPPTMTTAREAAAWTFNHAPEGYAPEIET
jgi:hypothetical protein